MFRLTHADPSFVALHPILQNFGAELPGTDREGWGVGGRIDSICMLGFF
jgi:hypothetical protein